jgi:hypothetical protein
MLSPLIAYITRLRRVWVFSNLDVRENKGKANFPCSIGKAQCREDVRGNGGIAAAFLTSALDGGEWSAQRPGRLTPGERPPGNHWLGG